MSESRDPLGELEAAAEAVIEKAAEAAEEALRQSRGRSYEQGNRVGLLWVHGLVGFTAGIQMALWGSATTIEITIGVWSRLMMAILGTIGGAVLIAGLSRRPRSIQLEAAGLILVGLWDFLMTLGLAYARWSQNDFHIRPITKPLPMGYVVAYPVTVYFGFFALICIHLLTLRRLKRTGPDLGGGRGKSS